MKHNKHQNQVRIIGGTHRGRKLGFADAEGLRPTPDMVREKVFNWLGQDLTGKNVLDLFAGSGALGLEAASRRAAKVVMVESNRQTARSLQQAAHTLTLPQVEIVCSDGLTYLNQTQQHFDVVAGRLNHGAMGYVEAGKLPERPAGLLPYREGKAGMSRFELLLYSQVAE